MTAVETYPVAGRFKQVESPDRYPNKCAVCGYRNGVDISLDRKFWHWNLGFDLPIPLCQEKGIDPRYIYQVYFCQTCAEEFARAVGFVPGDIYRNAVDTAEELYKTVAELQAKVQEYESAIGAINRIRPGTIIPDGVDSEPDSADSGADEGISPAEGNDSAAVESPPVERPVHLIDIATSPKSDRPAGPFNL